MIPALIAKASTNIPAISAMLQYSFIVFLSLP
jgi:hypothetical protein